VGSASPGMGDVSLVGAPREIEIQATRLSGGAPASRVWRRGGLAYDPTNSAHSTDSRRDIDHAFSDEFELFIYRGNTTTIRYGQRPKRRNDERCECDVEFIQCVDSNCVLFRPGDFGSRGLNHHHGNLRFGQ